MPPVGAANNNGRNEVKKAVLFLFGGLPACGKTTVARALARKTGACHLRIDTLEQALVRVGLCPPGALKGEGYQIACELAKDQLANRISVIADCVNPLELTRNWWRAAAGSARCRVIEVEFICSDAPLHRQRAESRPADIKGLIQPDWEAIQKRQYEAWTGERLVLDTARLTVDEAVARILAYVEK